MSELTPEQRLAQLEEKFKFMASLISRQSGEAQAFESALYSILLFVGNVPELRGQIELQLEKCAASNLAEGLNQDRNDGFDSAAELIRLALASAEERSRTG